MKRRAVLIGGAAVLAAGGLTGYSFARMGSSAGYANAMSSLRAPLGPNPDLNEIVRYAALAANGHNTQPWRFRLSQTSVEILPDFSRRTPVVDPDDHHLYVSLGCAAENLMLAAGAHGRTGELRFDTANGGRIVFDVTTGAEVRSALYDAIRERQSTRADYDTRPVPVEELAQMESAARIRAWTRS